MSSDKNKKIRTVQSVDRAVAIMKALAKKPRGLSLFELAAELKLHPQTVQSLVRTLQFHKIVFQSGPKKPYQTGCGILEIAGRWLDKSAIFSLAEEPVAELAAKTGEYVTLGELVGDEMILHFEVRPGSLIHGPVRTDRDRLHGMATGKLLMAALPEKQREDFVAQLGMKKIATRTITNRKELMAQLKAISKTGYAEAFQENSPYMGAIAVPVRDSSGETRAALGIAVPLDRLGPAEQKKHLAILRRSADEIELRWKQQTGN